MIRIVLIGLALGLIVCVSTAPDKSRSVKNRNVTSGITLASHAPNVILDEDENIEKEIDSDLDISVGNVKNSGLAKSVLENDGKDLANRGLVSDIINATITGVQFGIGLGTTNGTLDRLCIKIGGISMAGSCRRTVTKELESRVSNDNTDILTIPVHLKQ